MTSPRLARPVKPHALEVCHAKSEHETGWRALWSLYCGGALDATVSTATWRRICDPSSSLSAIVATLDSEVVGFAVYVAHECSWELDPVCYVEDVYVSKLSRGDAIGVGAAMAQHFLTRLAAGEWSRLYGLTGHENHVAQRLYGRFAQGVPCYRYVLKRDT